MQKSSPSALERRHDRVGSVIRSCGFGRWDRIYGTEGQCASFALALLEVLGEHGIPAGLRVCARSRSRSGGSYGWEHVVVAVGSRFYDVRGRVSREALRTEFGPLLLAITPEALRTDIAALTRDGASRYDKPDRYGRWLNLLREQAAVQPPVPGRKK